LSTGGRQGPVGLGGRRVWTSIVNRPTKEAIVASSELGHITGTRDKDYDIIWFTEQSLRNALKMETFIQDAEREGDQELADFFRRAQNASRKGAEQGKELLRARLGKGS
jgi:hypothetical protein